MREVTLRPMQEGDFEAWKTLFEGYCQFYQRPCDDSNQRTVWGWLMDADHVLRGMLAEGDRAALLGIAHYFSWPSTLAGSEVCYLSDLFVAPEARGKRVGKKLYLELFEECRRQGWPALQLLTQESNEVGRALYDQYGKPHEYLLYVSPLPE